MTEEVNEITVNIGSLLTGVVLALALVWAISAGEMGFAHFTAGLLTVLAVGNHVVNSFS